MYFHDHHTYYHVLREIARGVNSPWEPIAAIATSAAAISAWFSVSQIEKTRKDELLPLLNIDGKEPLIVGGNSRMRCSISNIGKGPAKNIHAFVDSREVKLENIESLGPEASTHNAVICHEVQTGEGDKTLVLSYKDAYERDFKTSVRLERQVQSNGNIGYVTHKDDWRFSRE